MSILQIGAIEHHSIENSPFQMRPFQSDPLEVPLPASISFQKLYCVHSATMLHDPGHVSPGIANDKSKKAATDFAVAKEHRSPTISHIVSASVLV